MSVPDKETAVFTGRTTTLLAGLVLIGPAGLMAQDTAAVQQAADTAVQGYVPVPAETAPAAPAGRAEFGARLGFVEVLPNRSADRIRADRADAEADAREAETELSHAQSERERTKAMVEVKKQEISTIDARRKLAEKNKNEVEEVTLEAEKKDAERHKTFLERRSSLHAAEIDRAKAAKKLADATRQALDLEEQLMQRRQERARSANVDPVATRRHDTVIAELEGKVLEAHRRRAEAQKQLADRDVDIARKRLELHKAQVAAAGQ